MIFFGIILNILGEVGETFKTKEERMKWLKDKVYAGTHVILASKLNLAKIISNDQFLKVQVMKL